MIILGSVAETMKIFNWVQRKFHRNVDNYSVCPKQDGLVLGEKKFETVTISEREALLEHVNFVEMIDGWKDGILTIGTFGFDPLVLSNEHNEYTINDEEEMCKGEEYSVADEETEKVNPVVVTAFKQEFQKVLAGSNLDTSVGIHRLSTTVDDIPLLQFLESPQIKSEIEVEEIQTKKRTTLAELFSADSDSNVVTEKSDPGEKQPELGKNIPVSRKKRSPSFAKKLLPSKGEESRSIKKIQRLVTKMLKKKIHPDLEGRQGKEGSIKDQSKTGISKDGTIEKASLLQDVVVAQL